jgi:hypothetical protein
MLLMVQMLRLLLPLLQPLLLPLLLLAATECLGVLA